MVTSSPDHREPGPSQTTGPARAVLDVGLSPHRALFSVFRDDPQTFDLGDRPFDVALKSLDARALRGFCTDLTAGGQAACDSRPARRSAADEFGIQRGERDQRRSPQRTDPIESLDLEKALAAVVEEPLSSPQRCRLREAFPAPISRSRRPFFRP